MRFLRQYIFANAGLKVLALGVSVLLWAAYTSEPFAEVGFQVALEFTSIPSQLEISGEVPTTVHVRVRGRSALLRRMTPSDLTVRIDLQNTTQGDSLVRITPSMIGAPFGANVVRVSPSEFHLNLVPSSGPRTPAG
jgi:YbbR-like protein